jgi:hypothetical protein
MELFTVEYRERLRAELVAAAKQDSRISGAAHLGSGAAGVLDRWSDIDLALCLAHDADAHEVISDWTGRFYREYEAAAHHDIRFGTTVYRVFLLKNTLQIDLSFWAPADFAPLGPAFKLIFGQANQGQSNQVQANQGHANPAPTTAGGSIAGDLIGMGWLYALHARSSLGRGRLWQAEYMVSGMRDHVLALACLRHGLPAHQGRGMDDRPPQLVSSLAECLVRSLDASEIQRALGATISVFMNEIEYADEKLAKSLAQPLEMLMKSTTSN